MQLGLPPTDDDADAANLLAADGDECSARLVAMTPDGQLVTFGTANAGAEIVAKTYSLRGSLIDSKAYPAVRCAFFNRH